MKGYAQHGVACLPVTALRIIQHHAVTLILSSEGGTLQVRHVEQKGIVLRARIFRSQNIHGISDYFLVQDGRLANYYLVLWGGRDFCVCKLTVEQRVQDTQPIVLFESTPARTINDWIMTIKVHPERPEAILLTAHNSLWNVVFASGQQIVSKFMADGVKTLLYCGSLCIPNDNHILIASGTVFGEVVFWICHRSSAAGSGWNMSLERIFLGHRGSIFGVAISEVITHRNKKYRFLASCSDDRTIRIWDVSQGKENPVQQADMHDVSNTGFGSRSDHGSQLTMAWGHLSRIWGIHFHPENVSDPTVGFLSRGEDGACQFWELQLDHLSGNSTAAKDALKLVDTDRYHAGKNVWSSDVALNTEMMCYTGGADGRIISRNLLRRDIKIKMSIEFRKISEQVHGGFVGRMKQYAIFEDGAVCATTDAGELVQIKNFENIEGELLLRPPKKSLLAICGNSDGGLLFYCLADGTLCAFDNIKRVHLVSITQLPSPATWMHIVYCEIQPTKQRMIRLVAKLRGNSKPRLITITCGESDTSCRTQTIDLPADFVISSSTFHHGHDILICGSRLGAVAVFDNLGSCLDQPTNGVIVRHVHSSDSVTSITILPPETLANSSTTVLVLTTGRDGVYAIHQIQTTSMGTKFETLHKAAPPFGPDIEGAHVRSPDTPDQALLLYGFKSTKFIVWDETHQTHILSVDCGGAHRNWSYSPHVHGSGMFVWTKAGTFNFYLKTQHDHSIVQPGGHGREVKALAVLRSSPNRDHACRDSNKTVLLASGAEDTEIRLFEHGSTLMKQIIVLKRHKTGLQALKFSHCGRFLFSSGGLEEFVVWKLTRISLVGMGAIVVAALENKGYENDARIMSFDILETIMPPPEIPTFFILMAYSNGKAKVFEFRANGEDSLGGIKLAMQLNIGTLCLTQAIILTLDESYGMLIGATDGILRFSNMDTTGGPITSCRVHQSNIAAMSAQKIGPETYAIATGGDDNGWAFTLLHKQNHRVCFDTLLVPSVHSAAVTAVSIIDTDPVPPHDSILVLSAGNDQKVQLWRVTGLDRIKWLCSTVEEVQKASGFDHRLDGLVIEKVCEIMTDVADISSLEIVRMDREEDGRQIFEAVAAGVGMQTLVFKVWN